MHRNVKSTAAGWFWIALTAVACLTNAPAIATEDRKADWGDGHCQKLVQLHMGQTAFQTCLEEIIADHVESKQAWDRVLQTAQSGLPVAEKYIASTRQFAISAWSELNTARPAVLPRSNAAIAILPKTAAIKTIHNLDLAQWWALHQDVARQVNSLQVETQILKIRFLKDSIAAGRDVFSKAQELSVRWASEIASASIASAPIAVAPKQPAASIQPNSGLQSDRQDEYWSYYSDCDHWQVTFENHEVDPLETE